MPGISLKNKLEKVVVNVGVGKLAVASSNFKDKVLPELMENIALVTGQKPATRVAKKSIAGFKVREGSVVGLKVTLRGQRMIDFLTRLNQVVLPRLRDFQGINLKNVDQGGNLSIGIKENYVFPEIEQEKSKVNFGVEVTVVPKDKNRDEAIDLYRQLGVPLKKN